MDTVTPSVPRTLRALLTRHDHDISLKLCGVVRTVAKDRSGHLEALLTTGGVPLREGANLSAITERGYTPLMMAAARGQVRCVAFLVVAHSIPAAM